MGRTRRTRGPYSSAPFLRRNTITPKKAIASAVHTMRTIEESMTLSPFLFRRYSGFPTTCLPDSRWNRRPVTVTLRVAQGIPFYRPSGRKTTRLPGRGPRAYIPFIIGISSRIILITTGPTETTNSEGRMQKKIGNTSFTPSFAAFSSATCRAWTRM